MNRHSRDLSVIRHIAAYCEEIHEISEQFGGDREVFMTNKAYRNGLSMSILQIGELVGHLSDDFRAAHTEIPWKQVKQMRNVMAHNYAKLDYAQTWKTVVEDIPELESFCARILAEEKANADPNGRES